MIRNSLILGLGNCLLSDDSIGLKAVRELKKRLSGSFCELDFKENYSGGIDLLEDITGYNRVIIIDSIECSDYTPGTCLKFDIDDLDILKYDRFVNTHGLNLPTLWGLGEKLGLDMPGVCRLIGIVVSDCNSFSENLSDKMNGMFAEIVEQLERDINNTLN